MVIYISMCLCVCLCTCREKWSWIMTCIEMLSCLQRWLREHGVRVTMRMALSQSFPPFYWGNKAERNKTKGLQKWDVFHPFRNRGRKIRSVEKIWNAVYSWELAPSPPNDEKGAVGETKSFKNIFLALYWTFPTKSFFRSSSLPIFLS